MNKYLVLGYFGYNTNQLDGQTVKTRDVYKLVVDQLDSSVDFYDTEDFKYRKLSIFKMFWKVISSKTIIYLPAHNNLKFIFPIIFCLSKIFRIKIHYFVIGGWLREFIANLPMHRYMLAHIEGIHSETKQLKSELESIYHLNNVDIFPNFRFFDFMPERTTSDSLQIVFMARVKKMKGLDWVFHLGDYLIRNNLTENYSISFYGPIIKDDKDYFFENLNKYPFMKYKGVLQPSDINETLAKYDVMLLPTHYYTEGLPGSIVDAYISGIPVIATEWKHAHEYIDNGKSGFIVSFNNGENELIESVIRLHNNRQLLNAMKDYVLIKRNEFAPPLLSQYICGC